MLEIYNETLASLLSQKINRALYEDIDDDEDIVPRELVETGMRVQKKAKQRKAELDEIIETKQKTLDIIDGMIKEEEDKQKQNDTGETGE